MLAIRLRSAAFETFYLNGDLEQARDPSNKEPTKGLVKGEYFATFSTWYYRNSLLINAYVTGIQFKCSFEKKGDYVRIKTEEGYLDAYNDSTEVKFWTDTTSLNQCWLVESGLPPMTDRTQLMANWSPVADIRVLQLLDFESGFRLRAQSAKIFYSTEDVQVKPAAALIHIPLVDINGDRHIILSNFKKLKSLNQSKVDDYRLLNPIERRLFRKMVVASESLIFAEGGLHNTTPKIHKKAFSAIILSIAGAQFEFQGLEYQDFIVDPKAAANEDPLFPRFYPQGKKPSFAEAAKLKGYAVTIPENRYLLLGAYARSIQEDLYLLLTTFQRMVPLGKKGRLRFVGFGLGFFARLDMQYSLTELLKPVFLERLDAVLKQFHGQLSNIAIIDFADGSGEGALTLKIGQKYGHILIAEREGDLLSVPTDDYFVGMANPSDVESKKGNEFGYDSIESLIGNNSSLRYDQVIDFNPWLANDENAVPIELPKFD